MYPFDITIDCPIKTHSKLKVRHDHVIVMFLCYFADINSVPMLL